MQNSSDLQRPAMDQPMLHALADNWWLLLLRGIASIAFGVLAFIWPGLALVTLVLLYGAFALVDGVLALWAAFRGGPKSVPTWWLVFAGLAGIGAGIVTLVWPGITAILLVLFIGLFVVNEAVESAGLLRQLYAWLASAGIDLARPVWLFIVTPVVSNLVSNVPAVMLLLPASSGPQAGAVLALASTLAGNLLIVGSIANIIVVEQAASRDVVIDWRVHARTGVPVTLATLAIAAAWLWART